MTRAGLAGLLLCCSVSLARADAAPGPWGVVVHTPFHAEALQALGVQWVRLDVRWVDTERPSNGVYDWAATDKLLAYYLERGFHVLAILEVGAAPPSYHTDLAHLPELREGIGAWAGAAAKRYAGRGIVWELGNEPETFSLNGLWRVPENYAAVARQEAAAIKHADPSALIAALSVAWMDRNFIVRALDAGLLQDGTIDRVSYHGYHRPLILAESGITDDVAWLRETVARHAPPGRPVTVIDSERGYALAPFPAGKPWGNWRNVVHTEAEQAAFLARHYLESIYAGVELVVWYKDLFGEDGFSLYYTDEHDPRGLRPMGLVYRSLAQLLPDAPARERNDRYDVTLLNNLTQTSDPNTLLKVRSYLRRDGQRERLIVALWNPVESSNGQVLESRRRVGADYVEAWRGMTPEDQAVLSVNVQIHGVTPARVRQVATMDLLAPRAEGAAHPIVPTWEGNSFVTPRLAVGAMPLVLVVDLAPRSAP
jgi:hypothetical protein